MKEQALLMAISSLTEACQYLSDALCYDEMGADEDELYSGIPMDKDKDDESHDNEVFDHLTRKWVPRK